MGAIELSGIIYFLPVLSFLVVFAVVYAVFSKTKIVESQGLKTFIAFLFATIFVSMSEARMYILNITIWFAILDFLKVK
ncbi:MAG: hypothetical protein AABW65_00735 [Nanoarchaeota archaeon]